MPKRPPLNVSFGLPEQNQPLPSGPGMPIPAAPQGLGLGANTAAQQPYGLNLATPPQGLFGRVLSGIGDVFGETGAGILGRPSPLAARREQATREASQQQQLTQSQQRLGLEQQRLSQGAAQFRQTQAQVQQKQMLDTTLDGIKALREAGADDELIGQALKGYMSQARKAGAELPDFDDEALRSWAQRPGMAAAFFDPQIIETMAPEMQQQVQQLLRTGKVEHSKLAERIVARHSRKLAVPLIDAAEDALAKEDPTLTGPRRRVAALQRVMVEQPHLAEYAKSFLDVLGKDVGGSETMPKSPDAKYVQNVLLGVVKDPRFPVETAQQRAALQTILNEKVKLEGDITGARVTGAVTARADNAALIAAVAAATAGASEAARQRERNEAYANPERVLKPFELAQFPGMAMGARVKDLMRVGAVPVPIGLRDDIAGIEIARAQLTTLEALTDEIFQEGEADLVSRLRQGVQLKAESLKGTRVGRMVQAYEANVKGTISTWRKTFSDAGAFTKADEDRLMKNFPTVWDAPDVARGKMLILHQYVNTAERAYRGILSGQMTKEQVRASIERVLAPSAVPSGLGTGRIPPPGVPPRRPSGLDIREVR